VITNAAVALEAVAGGHDVEIRMTGHVACVVGVTEPGGGRYTLTLAHDLRQSAGPVETDEDEGGNELEVVTLDTNTGKLTGTGWSRDFVQFIIERPE
jgi:hypothetical protein